MNLKINQQSKEYYVKISYLTRTNSSKITVDTLQDPDDTSQILTCNKDVKSALHEK